MTKLEFERRRRKWNQTDLAYHSRLTQGQISLIERRRFIPTPSYTERIGRALGVPADGLLDEVQAEAAAR